MINENMAIRRLVLDILKPHEPSIIELTRSISELENVRGVNSSLLEVDEEVKNFKVTVEGEFVLGEVKNLVEEASASIHSIDEVAMGEKLVEKVETPQDR
ncbi:MAG: DUF211 domain-containing protein [Candidatus Nanohaloarchaea archaeon]